MSVCFREEATNWLFNAGVMAMILINVLAGLKKRMSLDVL